VSSTLPYDLHELTRGSEELLTDIISYLTERYRVSPRLARIFEVENRRPQIREARYRKLRPRIEKAVREAIDEAESKYQDKNPALRERIRDSILESKITEAMKEDATSFLRIYFEKPKKVVEYIPFEAMDLKKVIAEAKKKAEEKPIPSVV